MQFNHVNSARIKIFPFELEHKNTYMIGAKFIVLGTRGTSRAGSADRFQFKWTLYNWFNVLLATVWIKEVETFWNEHKWKMKSCECHHTWC